MDKEKLRKIIDETKKTLGELDKAVMKLKEYYDVVWDIHDTIQLLQNLLRELKDELEYW